MIKKIIALLLFCSALITLIGLGTWQIQRLSWKSDVIRQLDKAYYKNADQLTLNPKELMRYKNADYIYGSVTGAFIYDKEIFVGPVPDDSKIGYRVITPMRLADNIILLVNRGWIEQDKRDQIKTTQPQGRITVTGLFRQPDWNSFTPENSPENNVWTKLDINQIASAQNLASVSPYLLYAVETSKDFGLLKLQDKKWYPRNKHRQYAIFWYAMAGVLCVIFGLFWRQRLLKKA